MAGKDRPTLESARETHNEPVFGRPENLRAGHHQQKAEIQGHRASPNGHVYFDLVDSGDGDGRPAAKVPVTLLLVGLHFHES